MGIGPRQTIGIDPRMGIGLKPWRPVARGIRFVEPGTTDNKSLEQTRLSSLLQLIPDSANNLSSHLQQTIFLIAANNLSPLVEQTIFHPYYSKQSFIPIAANDISSLLQQTISHPYCRCV